jgi:hypothetical protein
MNQDKVLYANFCTGIHIMVHITCLQSHCGACHMQVYAYTCLYVRGMCICMYVNIFITCYSYDAYSHSYLMTGCMGSRPWFSANA